MNRDQLYLLKPGFHDNAERYYCPGCAELLGLLEFYPQLKQTLDIHYIDYPRPRAELVPLLGEENQSCPVLVLGASPADLPPQLKVRQANGHAFVEGAREIGEYFAQVHGTAIPH